MTTGGLDSVLIRYVHVDQHEVTFRNSDEVYFGNDGGIWKCMDFTAEHPFIYPRNTGYNVTQFYSVSIHPFENVPQLMGGTQDNGTPYTYDDGIAEYKFVSGGDGAFTAFNFNNPSTFYTASQLRRFFRLDNSGFEIPDTITNHYLSSTNVLFINPFDIDATDPEILFQCSSKGLWRLDNASVADTMDWVKAATISGVLTAVATSADAPGIVYMGKTSATADIYKLDNGYISDSTTAPLTLDPNDMLPDAGFTGQVYCSSIVVDQHDADHVIVTYSNYGVESIWESENALSLSPVWINIEGDIPDIPVYWSAIHPLHVNVLYVATEIGVFYTDNVDGETTHWIPCTNFPLVRTDMLRVRENDLTIAAGTHGRGIWQSHLDVDGLNNDIIWFDRGPVNVGGRTRTIMVDPNDPSGQTVWAGSVAGGLWKTTAIDMVPVDKPETVNFTIEIFPNPASGMFQLNFNAGNNQPVRIDLVDIQGNYVSKILDKNTSGEQRLQVKVPSGISKGIYFIIVKLGSDQIVKKLVIS
ncbi:MAG: T9SS type A sorting domain-containing protein [Chitinophagales bacterium]